MDSDKIKLAQLALGRIFKMSQRPFKEGDIEEYNRCRAIIMEVSEEIPPWSKREDKGEIK